MFNPIKPFNLQVSQTEFYNYINTSSIKRIDDVFNELFSPNLDDDKKIILFGCIKLFSCNQELFETFMKKCLNNCNINCLEGLESLNEFIKNFDDEKYVYENKQIIESSKATEVIDDIFVGFVTPSNFVNYIDNLLKTYVY